MRSDEYVVPSVFLFPVSLRFKTSCELKLHPPTNHFNTATKRSPPNMASKLLVFALVGLALAAPSSSVKAPRAPCLSADFSMAMRIGVGSDAPFVSLTAIDSGHPGVVNIVGEKLARYPGTPGRPLLLPTTTSFRMLTTSAVYQKGPSGNATLGFDIKAGDDCETKQTGKFKIYVPDLGEEYGLQFPITASKHTSYPHFSIGDGYIEPQLTAASQSWYGKYLSILS